MLKRSSILPATTIVGIAESNPVIKRETVTAAKEGMEVAKTQKMPYSSAE